jgi:hypothetical protein
MQERMQKMQEQLAQMEVVGEAGWHGQGHHGRQPQRASLSRSTRA